MDKHLRLSFDNRSFLKEMAVGDTSYADLRIVNINSLKVIASQLKKAGLGSWQVLASGQVTRLS